MKIALEEHFLPDQPELFERWKSLLPATVPEDFMHAMRDRLRDVGPNRIEGMDEAGIKTAVLSAVPGVQGTGLTAGEALHLARLANDELAEVVRARPDRFAGFAAVPLQDPAVGAGELERAVSELGMRGAMLTGHTDGRYLDDPAYWVFWERAEALGVPVYLHAADAPTTVPSYAGRPELLGAAWSWTAETATHALRIVVGGVFDRFPAAQLILGHMGETLPFLSWRTDRQVLARKPEATRPSELFRRNVSVTTAGLFSDAALFCALAEFGKGRVMFSVDHPFEDELQAARWIEQAPLDDETRRAVECGNAQRLLGLD